MAVYHHALVLINSSQDGVPLLQHAARMAEENGMRITIAHISTDYRALNYVSDSLRDDRVSQEVIQAKALLNELACTVSLPVDTLSLVTTRRFEDVETCVRQRQIDLIIAGHHNRLLGVLSSHSLEYHRSRISSIGNSIHNIHLCTSLPQGFNLPEGLIPDCFVPGSI